MSIKYYFKFRQTRPLPPGSWVTVGPFETYEEAKRERENSKAWDCDVSNVFTATTKEEADAHRAP